MAFWARIPLSNSLYEPNVLGREIENPENGLYIDAKSGVDWLKNKGIDEENIIIYGESLGTGVAVEVSFV